MASEIERRFLVKGDAWKAYSKKTITIQQGYISTDFEEWITRIRIFDETKSEITLKTRETTMRNLEFSYPIPIKDALSIWKITSRRILKNRYLLDMHPGEWIVDCFQDRNYPLVIAEVEIISEKSLLKIPDWCAKEITGIKSLSNAYLANSPISNWNTNQLSKLI